MNKNTSSVSRTIDQRPWRTLALSAALLLTPALLSAESVTWTGAAGLEVFSWTDNANWLDDTPPATGDTVTFNASSTANLSTTLDAAYSLEGITVVDPTGAVTIANGTGGTLTIGGGGIDMSAASQNLTLRFTANNLVTFSASQNWNVASGRTLSFSGNANNRVFNLGGVTLTKTGTGNLSFSGVSLSNGTLDLQAGTTTITAGSSISATSTNTVSYIVGSDATLSTVQNTGTLTFASNIELNGGLVTMEGGGAHTMSGNWSGTGGTIRATGSSTGSGINKNLSGNFTGSGTFNLQSQYTSGTNHAITLSGNNSAFSGTFNINGTTGHRRVNITGANAGAANAIWNIAQNNILNVSAANVQLGTVNVAGTLNVNGANAQLGDVTVLNASAASTFNVATGGSAAISTGKTIKLGGSGTVAQTLNNAGTVTNAGTLDVDRSGILNINSGGVWTQTGDFRIGGNGGYGAAANINADGTFTYDGTSAIALDASAGTNSGASSILTIAGGTLATSQAFAYTSGTGGAQGQVIFTNGGTLKLNANLASVTTGSGLFQVGTDGGVIDTNGFDGGISHAISGIGSLTKTGDGVLTLTGDNSYSGGTFVNGGTLFANGSLGSGAVQVDAGTLGGTGAILGAVTVASGASLSPGNSTGTLIFGDSVTINAGGQVVIEIDTDNALFDILNFVGVNKDLIFDSGSELLVVNLGTDSLIGDYQIITGGATLSGLENLIISGDTSYNYALDASGLLSITPIPEPSTYALAGGVLLAGLVALRRRR